MTSFSWQYYIWIIIAVVLFSIQFVFTKLYQKQRGNGFFASIMMSLITSIAFIPFYWILNGGKFEITYFSLLVSVVLSTFMILCNFFGLKVLSVANLSVYTLFLMLGGMILPTIYGLFGEEKLTVPKVFAIVFVLGALLLTIKKDEKTKKISLFEIIGYAVIFLANGLCSVCTFVHQKSSFETVSASGFLLLCSLTQLTILSVMFFVYFICQCARKKNKGNFVKVETDKKILVKSWVISIGVVLGYAVVNGTAQLFSTKAAEFLEAGVQSTIATGGCIFLSAIFGLLFGEKITKKTIFSIVLAVAGATLMML